MPKRERIYKLGGSDPRSGIERVLGVIGKGLARPALKKQNRSWEDSPEKMAANKREAAESRAWEEHQRTGK